MNCYIFILNEKASTTRQILLLTLNNLIILNDLEFSVQYFRIYLWIKLLSRLAFEHRLILQLK